MNDRRSSPFGVGSGRWSPSLVSESMLEQDFSTRIVPYRNGPDADAYVLSAEGASVSSIERSLALGSGMGVDNLVRRTALRLFADREAWLEVAFGDEGERDGVPPEFRGAGFRLFEADGVRRTAAGALVQDVMAPDDLPPGYRHEGAWEPKAALDAERMVQASLPGEYPVATLVQVFGDLAAIGAEGEPDWLMQRAVDPPTGAAAVDAGEFHRTQRLSIIQSTSPIGWPARDAFYGPHGQLGEYYRLWRELRFLHFIASMRASAEDALRRVLALAGARCGFSASVTAYGVRTPHEVEEVMHGFEAGKHPLSEAIRIAYERPGDGEQPMPREVV